MSDTRNLGRVVDLLADIIKAGNPATRAIAGVEVIRGARDMAVALIITFTDGDRWTVAATPHRVPGEESDLSRVLREAGGQQLQEGVTYLPRDPHPWGS